MPHKISVPALLVSFDNFLNFLQCTSWPPFETGFSITGGYRKIETSFLKRDNGRVFTISK